MIKAGLISENKIKTRMIRFALLALGAILTGLTLVITELGIIEWVSLVPSALAIVSVCRDKTVRRRGIYGYGFFFFMCFYLVNYHWFVNLYPLDFVGGITKPAAVAVVLSGWVGLSVLQSLTGGLVFVLFGECVRGDTAKRFAPIGALIAGGLWAIFEWSQTLGWIGVPWGRLAIGQTHWLLGVQSASLFGSCFVTFLIVTVNFLIAYAIIDQPKRKLFSLLAAAIFLANTLLGAVIYASDTDEEDSINIAVVQGNISSQEKWSSELEQFNLKVYEEYTAAEAAEQGADIVVWPESALVNDVNVYRAFLGRLARENEVTILVGAFTADEAQNDYNSIVAVLPDGSYHDTVYSKRHLVPFGEYVPMRAVFEVLIPPLTQISMLEEDLMPGEGAQIMYLDGVGIGAMICFDSIYDELARDSVLSGADVLAISTNDSWFLDSAALDMHYAQAKLRAIENNRYVVRAANTGISGFITPTGESIDMLGVNERGQITAKVYLKDGNTLYTIVGNSFVYMCIAVIFLWIIWVKFEKKLDKIIKR